MTDDRRTGRWGIGPVFGTITMVYALAAWSLTRRSPSLFRIDAVPGKWLVGMGIVLLSLGTWAYIRALLVLNRALKTGSLAVGGPFAKARHPIYAAWLFLLLPGVGLVLRSWLVLSAAVVGYVSFRVLIGREEAEVAARHGDGYKAYCQFRRRLLPVPRYPRRMAGDDRSAAGHENNEAK